MGLVYGPKGPHGFSLNDQLFLNKQIQPESKAQKHVAVPHRQWLFHFAGQPKFADFIRKASPVHAFQQPRPECSMHLYGTPDNFLGQFIVVRARHPQLVYLVVSAIYQDRQFANTALH